MNQETVEYLKNFKTLLDEGLITQDEYEKKKKELLEEPTKSVAEPTGTPIDIPSISVSSEQSKQNTVGQQQASSNTTSKTNPIDIIRVVVGAVVVMIGLVGWIMGGSSTQYGGDYYTDQYAISCFTAQSINMLIAAVGSIEVCIGLKGLLNTSEKGNK